MKPAPHYCWGFVYFQNLEMSFRIWQCKFICIEILKSLKYRGWVEVDFLMGFLFAFRFQVVVQSKRCHVHVSDTFSVISIHTSE